MLLVWAPHFTNGNGIRRRGGTVLLIFEYLKNGSCYIDQLYLKIFERFLKDNKKMFDPKIAKTATFGLKFDNQRPYKLQCTMIAKKFRYIMPKIMVEEFFAKKLF